MTWEYSAATECSLTFGRRLGKELEHVESHSLDGGCCALVSKSRSTPVDVSRTKKPRDHGRQPVCRSLGGKEPNDGSQTQCLLLLHTSQFLAATRATQKVYFKWQGIEKSVASSMVLHGSGSKQIVGTTLPLELRNARLSMMRMASGYAAKTTAML